MTARDSDHQTQHTEKEGTTRCGHCKVELEEPMGDHLDDCPNVYWVDGVPLPIDLDYEPGDPAPEKPERQASLTEIGGGSV